MSEADYVDLDVNAFETAFLVGVAPDGKPTVFLDHSTDVTVRRVADNHDVRRACGEVASDLDAQRAAQYVMLMLKAVADEKAKNERPSAKVEEALKKRRRR